MNVNGIAEINPIRYRGYYYDTETWLYYLQTRYYDPATGRFISPDTVDYLDPETTHGLNLYAYCNNNPVMYADPTGHFAISALIIATVLGAVLGGVTSAVSQAASNDWDWSKVNPAKVVLDTTVGAISGLVAATSIGIGGSMLFGGVLAGAQSIAEDVLINHSKIDWLKLGVSIVVGVGAGLISGSGANVVKQSGVWKTSNSYLATAVSPKKIAMYTAKKTLVKKTLAVSTARFMGSMVFSPLASFGLL